MEIIARIVDESNFEEFKSDYGKTLVQDLLKLEDILLELLLIMESYSVKVH